MHMLILSSGHQTVTLTSMHCLLAPLWEGLIEIKQKDIKSVTSTKGCVNLGFTTDATWEAQSLLQSQPKA